MSVHNESYYVFTDGASRGNPGRASIGAVCFSEKNNNPTVEKFKASREIALFEISEVIGKTTNNQAEYKAVIAALKECKRRKIKNLTLFTDSQLIERQLKGMYKVKKPDLKPLYAIALSLVNETKATITHVPREQNKISDLLANEALDR